MRLDGVDGTLFAVWAPHARAVSVIGDWNGWDPSRDPMRLHEGHGIWERFVAGAAEGHRYKFQMESRSGAPLPAKSDPYATAFEPDEPRTASAVCRLDGYQWGDAAWMAGRERRDALASPISVYEVHLGSWRRAPGGGVLGYRELARQLADHVSDLGFTHVELLPVMEHPFYGSWGYQSTGYFAPTRRHGDPTDFMAFVDHLHQRGIGVILDWVPAHFPNDPHALADFDGAPLYEPDDALAREHPEWGTRTFDYGRPGVRNFLLASALFWLERYHADALRVDAVASMLYRDYGRRPGEWTPNARGGRENLEAIDFVRQLNDVAHGTAGRVGPGGVLTIAEEATAWPKVSRPARAGGLGFDLKWNMGWAHDVLDYLRRDPAERPAHQNLLTFGLMYAWNENFVLPLSHDEVADVRGPSLLGRMPGDEAQRFANLRLLYGFLWAYPGKKLLFMGQEIGQPSAWHHDAELPWGLLRHGRHAGVLALVRDLNALYRAQPALHEIDFEPAGFEWIDCSDAAQSVVSFVRYARDPRDLVVCVCNFGAAPRRGYRIGVPEPGMYREILNTDGAAYGGGNAGNGGAVASEPQPWHGRGQSVSLTLPALGAIWLTPTESR
jgi:1,4-alpha-glucan branching enzyme